MGHGQDRRIDQAIVDDQPRLHDQPRGAQRQQVGIARTGAYQPDLAGIGGGIAHRIALPGDRPGCQSVWLGAGLGEL